MYNGNWHTELLRAISLAEPEVESKNLKAATADLRHMLAETDECLHSVTVTAPLPVGIEPNYLLTELAAEEESTGRVTLYTPRLMGRCRTALPRNVAYVTMMAVRLTDCFVLSSQTFASPAT